MSSHALLVALAVADVEAEGCDADNYNGVSGSYGCNRASDGTYKRECASQLALTATRGAYYDEAGRLVYGTPFNDGIVGAEETGTIVLPRAEAERLVPQFTLEQMTVQGSAHDALAAQLTARQLSHLAFPLAVTKSGRRRAQANGGGAGAQPRICHTFRRHSKKR